MGIRQTMEEHEIEGVRHSDSDFIKPKRVFMLPPVCIKANFISAIAARLHNFDNL